MNRRGFCDCFQIPYRTVTDWEIDNRRAPEYVLRLLEYYIRKEEPDSSHTVLFETKHSIAKSQPDGRVVKTAGNLSIMPFEKRPAGCGRVMRQRALSITGHTG